MGTKLLEDYLEHFNDQLHMARDRQSCFLLSESPIRSHVQRMELFKTT